MKILAIETSCDETAAAFLEIKNGRILKLSSAVYSQVEIHAKTGGIVPEVAAREHVVRIIPVIEQALGKEKEVDVIGVTYGPGLITSLMIGVETAKALSYAWNKPLIPINHLEGHVYSNWLPKKPAEEIKNDKLNNIEFPALNLVISGGHSELSLMKNHGQFKKIGQTLDDAVGECFDKVAKILNLGYPGGPLIEKLAHEGDAKAFDFPRPMIKHKNYDFSFSGLKTAVLYTIKDHPELKKRKADLCASFQAAAFDVLIAKTLAAAKEYKVKSLLIGGGVTANQTLRTRFEAAAKKFMPKVYFSIPLFKYSTDNASMIAMATYFHALKRGFVPFQKVAVDPELELG